MSKLVGQRDVLGRRADDGGGPVGEFGRFLARDGSLGGRVGIDLDRPHVVSVVGKRGSGKSYTLGVLAEELAAASGVTGIVIDSMGVFNGLADVGARVIDCPTVDPAAIPPDAWPDVVGLDPTSPAGSLVWRAAGEAPTIQEMIARIDASSAAPTVARTATNHLTMAGDWGCFAHNGLTATELTDDSLVVLDGTQLPRAARTAVVGAVARLLYREAVKNDLPRLPWLLVDEAHAYYTGPAREALDTLLTRGRQPGVSLVLATQRPGALPAVAISQTDLLVAHRLTATTDIDALADAQPTSLAVDSMDRLPTHPGDALVVDDASESAATVRVRERGTPHGGSSPRASQRSRKD